MYYLEEIRNLDAWLDPEEGWYWNDTYVIEEFNPPQELENAEDDTVINFLLNKGILLSDEGITINDCFPMLEVCFNDQPIIALYFKD